MSEQEEVVEDLTMDDLIPSGRIRLAEITVCNWGPYSGYHTGSFHPDGTLITGDNGAGKSTMIDALQALMLKTRVTAFNSAADGEKGSASRSLVTYIRGQYANKSDGRGKQIAKWMREGPTFSGIRALFRHDDGAVTVLMGVYWINGSGTAVSDVHREFMVARHDLKLKEVIDTLVSEDGSVDRARLGARYGAEADVFCYRKHDDFSRAYREFLVLTNEKAVSLLFRAAGIKDIEDLPYVIREMVLEPGRALEVGRKAVGEFRELEGVHVELLDQRARRDVLQRLPRLRDEMHSLTERLQGLTDERNALGVHFARQAEALYGARLAELESELARCRHDAERLGAEVGEAQERQERAHAVFLQAGGADIQGLKDKIESMSREVGRIEGRVRAFHALASSLQIPVADDFDRAAYEQAHQQAERLAGDAERTENEALDEFGKARGELGRLREQHSECERELEDLVSGRKDSSIPPIYQAFRDGLADALDLDLGDLVFVAELIEVKDEERAWRGAIERALGGRRFKLLVPEGVRPAINGFINSRHLGINIDIEGVEAISGPAEFRPNGFLRKLNWKEHRYRDWLKRFLAGADLTCVDSVDALNATPYSMTREGLIHGSKRNSQKRDAKRVDDPREWVIGFSSATRKQALEVTIRELEPQIADAGARTADAKARLDRLKEIVRKAGELARFEWDELNLGERKSELSRLVDEVEALRAAGGKLAEAERAWQDAKAATQAAQERRGEAEKAAAVAEDRVGDVRARRDEAQKRASVEVDEAALQRLSERLPELLAAQLGLIHEIEERARDEIDKRISAINKDHQARALEANRTMATFRSKWEAEASELSVDMASLGGYIAIYEQIVEERLPEQVDRFQKMLNRNAMQSLSLLQSEIEEQAIAIEDRISAINRILSKREFVLDHRLNLVTHRLSFDVSRAFDQAIRNALADVADDDEARFARLKTAMQMVAKASDPASCQTLESLRMLDARYRIDFSAEKILTETGEVVDVIRGDDGKSGGEKEIFAAAILASSLTYAFTPDGAAGPRFCSVFVDEAFSKTSDGNTRRALGVFGAMGLHLTMITPLSKVEIAREAARSVLLVEKSARVFKARLLQFPWEELDRIRGKRELETEARRHGISVEEDDEAEVEPV